VSDCIVIAVLNGIEISHKLFTPEMVADARAIRGCESVLGMPLCRLIPVQLWTNIHGDTNWFTFCKRLCMATTRKLMHLYFTVLSFIT